MSEGKTTIQVSKATLEKLKVIGKKGESYETIILRLLNKGEVSDE